MLRGRRVLLRPLTGGDVPALLAILAEPAVARWWGRYDEARLSEDLGAPGTEAFAVEVAGELGGVVLVSEENTPDYRHASLDITLATRLHGQGYGTETLRVLARHLLEERGHHRLTIDPAAENAIAIRAYERVGFRPVGVMRRYERAPDGSWRDGLLMDLLADELTEPGGDARG